MPRSRDPEADGCCEKCGKYCGEHIFDDCCCSCFRGCCGCFTERDGCAYNSCRGCYFCCNKCIHQGNPTVEEHYEMCKVNDHKRKCTDFGCCILFFAWWIFWLVLAFIALEKGDPIQLIYGQDYQGAQCGIDDYEAGIAYPNHANQKKVVYPRLGTDLEEWAQAVGISDVSDIDWTTLGWDLVDNLNLTGVCVSSCPSQGDVVCTDHYVNQVGNASQADVVRCYTDGSFAASNRYMCDNCWVMSLNTTDVFNRCLELIVTNVSKDMSCVFPQGVTDMSNCITVSEIVTSQSDKPTYSSPFQEWLSAGFQFVSQALSDIDNAQDVVWTCGIALPFFGAFVYIFFLYWCAYPLVWGTILLYLAVHFWVTLWLWMQSGYVELGDLQNSVVFSSATSSTNDDEIANLGENDTATFNNGASVNGSESTDDTYLAFAIISSILYAVGICIIAAVFTQVRVAVRIIQETSKALAKIPTLMLYPIFSVAAICLLILYFITVGTYLFTMDDVTPNDLGSNAGLACEAANCTTPFDFDEIVAGCVGGSTTCPEPSGGCSNCDLSATQTFLVNYMTTAVNNGHISCTAAEINAQIYGSWDCGVGLVDADTSLNQLMFCFHLLSFLWTLNFVDAIGICVIAGAVCQWYWILPSRGGNKKLPSRFPVLSSVTRVYRFHLGSMAYGSAIVAIVQFLRAIMAYVDAKTKNIQEKNCIVRYLMKVVHCCLWFFEKCIKFITKNAYIYVAMRGYSFCKASRNAFNALLHNMSQFAVTHVITTIFIFLGKIVITLTAGFVAYIWVEYDDDYGEGQEKELYLPILPVVVTSIVAYFATTNFLNVYDLSIASVLLCFCEDYRMHVKTGKSHMAFMSQSLRDAVIGEGKTLTKDQVDVAIKNNLTVSEIAEGKVSEQPDKGLTHL